MRSPLGARSMTGMGHEERFPPPRLSAGYGFRKETIAGTRRNGRDAPIRVIRLSCSERVKPDPNRFFTQTSRASTLMLDLRQIGMNLGNAADSFVWNSASYSSLASWREVHPRPLPVA